MYIKNALLIFLILTLYSFSQAQSSVFVAVDVSGSGPRNGSARTEAKTIVRELCLGKYNSTQHPLWRWAKASSSPIKEIINGKTIQLLDPKKDGLLMIIPAGLKNTYQRYKIQKISDLNSDFNSFYSSNYPTTFLEKLTYIDIVRAMSASIAKSQGIKSYYYIEVTDGLYDTGSKVPHYTASEKDILAAYGSNNSSVIKLGTLYFEGPDNRNYQIVISRVNVQNINIPASSPGGTNVTRKNLELIRPNNTSRAQPFVQKSGVVSTIWRCLGCSDSTFFTVKAVYIGNATSNRPKSITQKVSGTKATIHLSQPGLYKVTVSSQSPLISAKPTYIKITGKGGSSKESGNGLLWLFMLLAAAGLIYYFVIRKGGSMPKASSHSSTGKEDKKENSYREKGDQGDSSSDSNEWNF